MKKQHMKKLMTLLMTIVLAFTMNAAAFAGDLIVVDIGTFHNVYVTPTDEWIEDGWDHEVIETDGREYLVLKKYTGEATDLVIYGEATVSGSTYPVMLGLKYDPSTGRYSSYFNNNTTVKSVKFVSVNATQVIPETSGKANEMFKGMTALEKVEFNNSFGGALEDISGMFEGCTSLKTADLTGLDLSECKKADKTFKDCIAVTSTKLTDLDLKKVTSASQMFSGCTSLTDVDLSEASWGNVLEDTSKMFNGDDKLGEITVPDDFTAGTASTDMFKTSEEKNLLIKGAPSNTFINRVCPTLESSNRYLGEVSVKASVTLSGADLKADMFTCKLYSNSISEDELIKTVKNDSSGNFNFGNFKISDISKKVKFIAVQDKVENVTNKTGTLTSETTIKLNTDGTLKTE